MNHVIRNLLFALLTASVLPVTAHANPDTNLTCTCNANACDGTEKSNISSVPQKIWATRGFKQANMTRETIKACDAQNRCTDKTVLSAYGGARHYDKPEQWTCETEAQVRAREIQAHQARVMEATAREQQRIADRDAKLRNVAPENARFGCQPGNLWKFVAIDQSIVIEPDLDGCLAIMNASPTNMAAAWKFHKNRSPATTGAVSNDHFVLAAGTFRVTSWLRDDLGGFKYTADDGKTYTVGKFDYIQNANSTYRCLQNKTCRVDPAGENAPRPTLANGHTLNSNLYYFMEYDEELTRTLGYWVPYHQATLPGVGLIFDSQPATPPMTTPAQGNSEVYLPIRKQAPGY